MAVYWLFRLKLYGCPEELSLMIPVRLRCFFPIFVTTPEHLAVALQTMYAEDITENCNGAVKSSEFKSALMPFDYDNLQKHIKKIQN